MALIPNRIVRISLAYKIWCFVCLFVAAECFIWDLYTHELLEETQAKLEQALENEKTLLRFVEIEILDKRCEDGSK